MARGKAFTNSMINCVCRYSFVIHKYTQNKRFRNKHNINKTIVLIKTNKQHRNNSLFIKNVYSGWCLCKVHKTNVKTSY